MATRTQRRTLDVIRAGRDLFHQYVRDDVAGLAAELAYNFFLALFPFFIFVAALGSLVTSMLAIPDPVEQALDLFGQALPRSAEELIRPQLDEVIRNQSPGLLSLGILGAIWAATGGTLAIMKAMNRAYDVLEERPIWKQYLIAIGLTILAGVFILGAFILFAAGQLLGLGIATRIGLAGPFEAALPVVYWVGAVVLVMLATAFIYWKAPNARLDFRWITPGAVLFTVFWIAATYLFIVFVSLFGTFSATYGALAGVVVLLLWFYLTGLLLTLGAEVNAVVDAQLVPKIAEIKEEAARRGRPVRAEDHEEAPPRAA
jgi:membrane protein